MISRPVGFWRICQCTEMAGGERAVFGVLFSSAVTGHDWDTIRQRQEGRRASKHHLGAENVTGVTLLSPFLRQAHMSFPGV